MSIRPQVDVGGGSGAAILARRLAGVPEALRPRLRPVLRTAGERFRAAAADEASWSSRIPQALTVRTHLAGRKPGVVIVARADLAPHARPLEGFTTRGREFRHPVFGNREVWVSQAVRPFLGPAAVRVGPGIADDLLKAADSTLRDAGF